MASQALFRIFPRDGFRGKALRHRVHGVIKTRRPVVPRRLKQISNTQVRGKDSAGCFLLDSKMNELLMAQ